MADIDKYGANGADAAPRETERKGRSGAVTLGVVALFVLLAGFGLYTISGGTAGGTIDVSTKGVAFKLNPDQYFADLLDAEIARNPQRVETLLSGHNYFQVASNDWVNKLRDLELGQDVSAGLRQLLYDRAGPFKLPDTFSGADAGLVDALVLLDQKAAEFPADGDGQANAFLAAIWKHNLDRSSIFSPRGLHAEVRLLNTPQSTQNGRHLVYACRSSQLEGKEVTLYLPSNPSGNSQAVTGFVVIRPDVFDSCPGNARNLEKLLGNQPARFGLAGETFRLLNGTVSEGETLPPRLAAKFQVLPKFYTAVRTHGKEG